MALLHKLVVLQNRGTLWLVERCYICTLCSRINDNLKTSKSKEESTKLTGHRGEKYHANRRVFTGRPRTAVPNPNPSKYWRRKVLVGSYGLENIYISRIASYNDKKGHFFTEITFWKGIAGILKNLGGPWVGQHCYSRYIR